LKNGAKGCSPSAGIRIRRVSAAKIMIFGPAPEYNPEVPRLIAKHNTRENLEQFVGLFQDKERVVLARKMRDLLSSYNVTYIDKIFALCGDSACPISAPENDGVLFVDYGHLSVTGAKFLGQQLVNIIPSLADLLFTESDH
jgi:hypothetical protein